MKSIAKNFISKIRLGILPIIEDQPDQKDQPVELGFPLGLALLWGYPPSSPPDLYFQYFCDFSYFCVIVIFS